MPSIPVGVQLYSVREECSRDLPGTLAALAKMGYAGVEFAGYHGRSARELRGMLDDLELRACGTHTGLDTLLGDQFEATVAFNQELGNRYLVVPWIGEERRNTKSAWLETAALFSQLAEKLRPHGMLVGYHNHDVEFHPMEGSTGFDVFYGAADPAVIMQLDLGNAIHGGADPLVYLKRYPGRSVTIHLKEFSSRNPRAIIGEGEVDWGEVFALCEAQGKTEWYIVEHESDPTNPLDSVARCREALRKMGK